MANNMAEKTESTNMDAISTKNEKSNIDVYEVPIIATTPSTPSGGRFSKPNFSNWWTVIMRFAQFAGPGTLISVAYVDPDNFQTGLSAGVHFQYKLLCIILLGCLMAIYLQFLAAKLGCVTGLNLAQMNRAYLPRWLNLILYVVAEAAIISTDIGQVIGTAIALNLLVPKIPLAAGCAISVADTLFILLFYNSDGTLRRLRWFEGFVSIFIIAVFISFCMELALIEADIGEVFRGYLPSKEIFVSTGLYQSCAILGGIMMPHSLYLGSGLVQVRMQDFDKNNGIVHSARPSSSPYAINLYRPTLSAIKSCMSYTVAELCISLFFITLFINSAILIVAAASLSAETAGEADLPAIYDLFVSTISQASGTLFALALLFSGISAGIVCTMAGQLVCEGALDWRMSPFYRRLATRCISVVPAVVISASQGQEGLAATLNALNVLLAVTLIFITFPLVWYTSFDKYMRVNVDDTKIPMGVVDGILDRQTDKVWRDSESGIEGTVSLANGWVTAGLGWLVWLVVTLFNIATLTLLALGLTEADG